MAETEAPQTSPPWHPLSARERRIVGVLAEKAKTTQDVYPMSINALRAGCNQKSNRDPVMNLEAEDVEESLDRLRGYGAATEVSGSGRVLRYRHYLYDWLGVDKVELAVMAELLLRGAQTVGELRGRAARMEPIADVSALRPILLSLQTKGLVISLTPEGRGQIVTHALYSPSERERLQASYPTGDSKSDSSAGDGRSNSATAPAHGCEGSSHSDPPSGLAASSEPISAPRDTSDAMEEVVVGLHNELVEVQSQLAQMGRNVEELSTKLQQTQDELTQLKILLGE